VVIDSRSGRSAPNCFDRGIDGGKKIRGVKIHVAVGQRIPARPRDFELAFRGLPNGWRSSAAPARVHVRRMFIVTEADSAAIRTAVDEGGDLAAAELRRRFPGITACRTP
jgi:hypothetical protein